MVTIFLELITTTLNLLVYWFNLGFNIIRKQVCRNFDVISIMILIVYL